MKPWTRTEIEAVRRRPGTMRAVAAALGRTASQVNHAIGRYRLPRVKPRDVLADPEMHAIARRMWLAGRQDEHIARKLGVHQSTVCRWRKRLGLAAHGWNAAARKRTSRRLAEQWQSKRALARLGIVA